MADNDIVYFTEITPLINAQPGKIDAHQFKLKWSFDKTISFVDFTKFEIYRYIGSANTCVSNITESDPKCKLRYRVTKITNTSSRVEEFKPNPLFNVTKTESRNILDYINLTDDLSIWYARASESLMNYHGITDSLHDEQLLQQIYTGERTIFYLIKSYIKNAFDTSPYCIGAHKNTQIVDCTSTKNQVKHNTLHYEGDYIWETNCSTNIPFTANGMSRTAVDTSRIYSDLTHQGPTGRGGYCWVSDRGSSKATVARFNLSNGLNTGVWNSPGNTTNGGAIAIRIKDGACYSGTGDGKIYLINSNALPEFATGSAPQLISSNVAGGALMYGATNVVSNNSDKIIFTARRTNSNVGSNKIFTYDNDKLNSLYSYKDNERTYGIAAGRNGDIYNGFAYAIDTNFNGRVYRNGNNWAQGGTANSVTTNNPRKTTNYNVYFGGDRGGSSAGLWYKTLNSNTTKNIYSGEQAKGFGIDGENNIWGLGNKRLKIYHIDGDSAGDNSSDYPYGLYARYPSYTLKYARSSETNTKWVEWFLTRNSFNLDDTIKLTWRDPITQEVLSLTAKEAWYRLVDSRRKEDNNGYFKVWKDPHSSTQYSNYSKLYGIKFKHLVDIEQYSPSVQTTKYSEAYTLVKLWSDLYADVDSTNCYPILINANNPTPRNTIINKNLLGRLLHPNHNASGGYIADRLSDNTTRCPANSYLESRSTGSNGATILTFTNVNGYSYQYSDFTGNLLSNAVSESPYSTDTIHPEVTYPTLIVAASAASQSNIGYQDINANCVYPWKETSISLNDDNIPTIMGYDDLTVSFFVSADPGTFIIRNWSLSSNDYDDSIFTSSDNKTYLSDISKYNNIYYLTYTYKDPSLYGIYYLPSGVSPVSGKQYQISDYRKPDGYFTAASVVTCLDLYSCQVNYSYAYSYVKVLERWPEQKFFISMTDSQSFREDFFN